MRVSTSTITWRLAFSYKCTNTTATHMRDPSHHDGHHHHQGMEAKVLAENDQALVRIKFHKYIKCAYSLSDFGHNK